MRLRFRPIGAHGEPYPAWLRELRTRSGAYVIRQARRVVYVGESHSNKLYGTITRHFQTWDRWKSWWRGLYGPKTDPGQTYSRAGSEIAVLPTAKGEAALQAQARLIRRLRPRDNVQERLADVPF